MNTQTHTLETINVPKISIKRQPVTFGIMWWRCLMSVKKNFGLASVFENKV